MAMENGNVRLVTKRKSGLADGGNDGIQDGERGGWSGGVPIRG